MSISYCKTEIKNPLDRTKSLYYLCARAYASTSREWLIEDMVRYTSLTAEEATTAIDYLFEAIPRYLRLGMTVQLGKFGYFKYTIKSQGSELPEDATPDKIKSIHLRFVPGKGVRKMVGNFKVSEWKDHF